MLVLFSLFLQCHAQFDDLDMDVDMGMDMDMNMDMDTGMNADTD